MGMNKRGFKVVVTDRLGQQSSCRAEHLEILLGDGRRLLLDLSWGDSAALQVVAESESESLMLRPSVIADNAVALGLLAHEPPLALPHSAPEPMLNLRVQKALSDDDKLLAPRKHHIRRWARAALLVADADVTVRLVGEEEGQALNRDYRGKDYPTNVLTFCYHDDADAAANVDTDRASSLQGDLVLCVPVIAREALAQQKAVDAHFAHLIVHGMLHLQGYDHETTRDAEAMEVLEIDILERLGYANPYVG